MKRSTQLRYASMGAFVIGYVGISTYIDPVLLLFIALAVVGFSTTKDVIRLEEVESELTEHKKISDEVKKALEEMDESLKQRMSEPEGGKDDGHSSM